MLSCKQAAPIALVDMNGSWSFDSQARDVSKIVRSAGTLKPSENIL